MQRVPESDDVVYEGMCRWINAHRVPFQTAVQRALRQRRYCPTCLGDPHPIGSECPEATGGEAQE